MKSQLEESGIELLKILGKYAEVIMAFYSNKEVPADYDNDKVLNNLREQGILWRPSTDEDLRLNTKIRNFLGEALKDEHNRQIDTNMGNTLNLIKTQVGHYKEDVAQHRYRDSEKRLESIEELVFGMMESLQRNLDILWTKIHNEFSLVASLSAKIRENELAQKQVETILNCLEMVSFKEFDELVGSDGVLRRLLMIRLQSEIEIRHQELSEIQRRLSTMLGHFKEIQFRSKLVRGFDLFLEQHPNYLPPCYPETHDLNRLFNQIQVIKTQAQIDVNVLEHQELFIDWIQSTDSAPNSEISTNHRKATAVVCETTPDKILEMTAEEHALEDFFCAIVDSHGEKISAINYYQHIDFEWDVELWLFGVLGYLEKMDKKTKENFGHQLVTQPHSFFSGNRLIEDVSVWMN
jgi:hypothetical protein